jgi:hypothetical protein
MKKTIRFFLVASTVLLSLGSCTKEKLNFGFENPIDIELSSQWIDGEVTDVQNEIWYRVEIGTEVSQIMIEWTEKDYHGPSRDYTADILVDAYWLDGETDYFLGSDIGYGSDAKLISLSQSSGLLIKVRLNNNTQGTFGLKVYEKENSDNLELIPLTVGNDWYQTEIGEGENLGFLVSGGVAGQEVIIQWAEFDSPESGYTADIKGSVFMLDMETAYLIVDNGKSFLGKDASHSDNPKSIKLDSGETDFVIIVSLNNLTKPGSFALQVK